MTANGSREDRLRARVAQLEAENVELRLSASNTAPSSEPDATLAGRSARKHGLERSRWWTALATVLIVLGALLAPAGLISSWAQRELTDTDAFVATFAPLAEDPQVQSLVTAEVTDAINEHLQIEQLTANLVEGLSSLDLGPRASAALKALEGPAAQGIENIIRSVVQKFVSSPQFAELWSQLLRTTHKQMIKTMQGSPSAAVTIAQNGEIGIQLGPIISAVKEQLVQQGLAFAAKIPVVSRTIVIAKSDSAVVIQSVYALAIGLGLWVPWASLLFLVAGVAIARRRAVALVWAGVALALTMVLTAAGLSIGRIVVTRLMADMVPRGAAHAIYNQIIAFIADTVLAIGVLAFAVAVIAWFAGPSTPAVRLRHAATNGLDALRHAGDRNHFSTGALGRWLDRQTVLIRILIALSAAAVILFTRPITVALIIWTAVIALILVLIVELLRRDRDLADPPPSTRPVADALTPASARRPESKFLRVAYDPDVLSPVAVDVEGERCASGAICPNFPWAVSSRHQACPAAPKRGPIP